MKLKRSVWISAFTLTGTIIGAGILGLPYVFSQSGFFIGVFWLFLLGVVMLFLNLCLGEVTLRTKSIHQLPGYAEKYLGKFGKNIMLFAVVFGLYSALLAYLIGEGQSFSKLFFGDFRYAIYFAVGFWALMTMALHKGLKELKKIEVYGVIAIVLVLITMLVWFYPSIDFNNLNYYNLSNFFLPFGIILFALLGFTSIPEMRMEIKGDEKLFKKAILLGSLIPVFLYVIFNLIFVGVLGNNISQISTLSFGNLAILLGILTMLTSYFVLSFSLRDIFFYDLKKKKVSFLFVSVIPLVIYLLVTFFNLADFVMILGIGGVISGGITAILIFLMNLNAKKKGNRKPEFSVPMNWWIIGVLSLIFIIGIFIELF